MKFSRFLLIAALASLALAACKKEEEEETTKNYMTGSIAFSLDRYVNKNITYTLTPTGITDPASPGFYWHNSWEDVNDTTKVENGTGDGSYTFATPNALGEFTVYCVAFASDYYTSTTRDTIFVVDPTINTSLSGLGLENADKFVDSRDGKTYYTTEVGGKTWLKNNLGYDGSGVSFYESEAMDEIFGRMYSWNEAIEACPDGWHLPTDAEFVAAAEAVSNGKFSVGEDFKGVSGAFMADAKFLDEKMWEYWPQVVITNKTGLSAYPMGYCTDSEGSLTFMGMKQYSLFWTATDIDDNGMYRYMYVTETDIHAGLGDKDSFRLPVRCVKD